jgi:hypothetical protein
MSSQGSFGKLTVLEIRAGSKEHHRVASCRCVCGGMRLVRLTRLKKGSVVECAKCSMQTARAAGKYNRRRLTFREAAVRNAFGDYRRNALRKGIPFDLSLDGFRAFVTAPCAYCGTAPERNSVAGVDRLMSTRGYVAGNVTSCCSECNYAKGDLTPEEFLELVRRIYRWSCAE